jgi:hypothetical protein
LPDELVGPKIFLDVDGVLNRFTDPSTAGLEEVRVAAPNAIGEMRTYSLTVNRPILVALDALVTETNADLVWLTSWNANSAINLLVERLDLLHGGRVLPNPLPRFGGGYLPRWKVEALLRDQRNRLAPFVWIDDENGGSLARQARRTFAVPSLIITPDGAQGLTTQHLESISEFLSREP